MVCTMYAFLSRPFFTKVKGFKLIKFLLNEILQMSKFKFFVSRQLLKYFWNLQMLRIIEKFINWKILLKNSWKIGTAFGRQSWKIGTLSWTIDTSLARWRTKLKNWHVKMRSWHAFGTLARGHVYHAGTHSTRFSKLDSNMHQTNACFWEKFLRSL